MIDLAAALAHVDDRPARATSTTPRAACWSTGARTSRCSTTAFEAFWRKPRRGRHHARPARAGRAAPLPQAALRSAAAARAGARATRSPSTPSGRAAARCAPRSPTARPRCCGTRTSRELTGRGAGRGAAADRRRFAWRLGERRTRRRRAGTGRGSTCGARCAAACATAARCWSWARRAAHAEAAAARRAGRHQRLDGALHAPAAAVRSTAWPRGWSSAVEAFVFGTRLTRITRQLRGRDVDARAGRGLARACPTGRAARASARRCAPSTSLGPARARQRRGGAADQRRLGPRRARAAARARWRACSGAATA